MPKVVFLDTMIYLHFKPVGDIDWPKLLRTDSVRIVVPRITISELDKHKDTHSNSKVKDRARRALHLLEGIAAGTRATLRKGVEIERFRSLPSFDLGRYELDPARNDDVMIAAALEFVIQNPDAQIVLVSDDASARMNATDVGLDAISLPDELRLRGEVDPVEVENRELRQQLARLQNAMPKLTLGFRDNQPSSLLHVQLWKPTMSLERFVEVKIAAEREKHPPLNEGSDRTKHEKVALAVFAKGEVARYQTEREVYLKKLENYLCELWNFQRRRALSFAVSLYLFNEGTAVADDTDVYAEFPTGIELKDEEEFQDERAPKPPTPPTLPRTYAEKLSDSLGSRMILPRTPHVPDFSELLRPSPPPNVSRTRIDDNGRAHWKVQRIKHKQSVPLRKLTAVYDDFDSAIGFTLKYRLHTAALPDEIVGDLHVRVELLSP